MALQRNGRLSQEGPSGIEGEIPDVPVMVGRRSQRINRYSSSAASLHTVVAVALVASMVFVGCSRKPKDLARLESGNQFMAKKDYARAALEFRSAIQANPRNVDAYYRLALAQLGLRDKVAAYRSFSKVLDLDPKHTEAQLRMAELLVTSSDPETLKEAMGHAQAVLDASPDDPDALSAMAAVDFRLGERDQAMELLEQASSKAPQHLKTSMMLAIARWRQKDNVGGEQVLKRAVETAPDSPYARLALGAFDLLIGKNQQGEQQLRIVLEKDPNHVMALWELATMLDRTGRKSEAEQMYRRLATGPASAYQPLYAGYLFRIGKQKEGVLEFERLAKLNPNDVNARTRLVAAYVATKRMADAQRLLKAALDKNPKDTAALLQRSELSLMAGAYVDARKDLNEVLHYAPDAAKAHFLLSNINRAEGNLLTQHQELNETLRLNPRFFTARIALTLSYIVAGEGKTALELINRTPEDQQNSLGFIEYRNWSLLAAGDLKELRQGIDRGLAKARTRGFLMQDALLKLKQHQVASAQSSLLEILKSNPEDLGAVDVLLGSYADQKQVPVAIEEVRALLAERPNSAALKYRLGALLASTGKSKDARAAFIAAVAANPQLPSPRLALARMDREEGKSEAARQWLTPLLSSKSTALPAEMGLGEIEAKGGNYGNAIEHFRKVVEADPKNFIALNNLAYLLADHTDQADEALKYAQRAKELAPNDINVEGTFGWVYFRKGLYGLALQHLQEAVNREGKIVVDGTAIRRYHLAMAYKRVGDDDKAAKTLSAALKLDPNLPEARVATQMLAESK